MAWHMEEVREYSVDEDYASQPPLGFPTPQSTSAKPAGMTWAEFDEIVKPQTWSKALAVNSHLWSTLCQSWEVQLRETFHLAQKVSKSNPPIGVRTKSPLPQSRSCDKQDPHYSSVVAVLREMRRVPRQVYRSPEWQSAVRVSPTSRSSVSGRHRIDLTSIRGPSWRPRS